MKVSIITVTYNSEKYLHDCLESVFAQGYPNIELILIDGASKDGTVDIVKSYGEKITHFVSEPDRGIYDAMNKGLRLATGDIIGILNSDDLYNHNAVIEKVVQLFKQAECDAVYGDLVYVREENTDLVTRRWVSGTYKKGSFLFGWMPAHPTFFVTRRTYLEFGNFTNELRSAADYEIMLRFLYKYNIQAAYLPEVLVRMREGGLSNASIRNRIKANREDKRAWQMNGLKPYFFTIWLKPLRKITQFIFK